MGGITCKHCETNGSIKLRKQFTTSGVAQIAWYCLKCKQWAEKPARWLAHSYVKFLCDRYHKTIDDIVTIKDYRGDYLCVICGEPSEVHHWAPQAMQKAFGADWVLWPTAPLCVKHHRQWHDTVTPNLSKGNVNALG